MTKSGTGANNKGSVAKGGGTSPLKGRGASPQKSPTSPKKEREGKKSEIKKIF
jgi:hypothetical protein